MAERTSEVFDRFGFLSESYQFAYPRNDSVIEVTIKKAHPSFDLVKEISNRSGVVLEVGGPTELDPDDGILMRAILDSRKKLFISNIKKEVEVGKLDLQLDATRLGVKDRSLNILFASCLPIHIQPQFMVEAKRVLTHMGLLIAPGLGAEDIVTAKNLNLEPIELIKYNHLGSSEEFRFDGVFGNLNLEA